LSGKIRDYLFYDTATSVCSDCLRRSDGKIIIQDDSVFMDKICYSCGKREKVLLADDVDYYKRCREVYVKPSEMPEKWNTPLKYGCPYDCGLCPSHEQHSCLTLIEITDHCNLRCPICYASSGPERHQDYREFEHVIQMLDKVVENEGEPDVIQISGGEPTLHPDFFRILDEAKARPIRHIMVNTNGIRIANDPEFVAKLAEYMPGFEIYLQFDSLEKEPLLRLRGADLREIKRRALENLNAHNISTTLVSTISRGLNDDEMGKLVEFAISQPCVRGITFQPIQDAGRSDDYQVSEERLTLTEVRRRIGEQSSIFTIEDLLPVPCHPDSLSMAYALKVEGNAVPITRYIDDKTLLSGPRSTIQFEKDPAIHAAVFELLSTGHSPQSASHSLAELLCCLPELMIPSQFSYENVFRIIIMDFIDAHSFDLRSIKKTCVHIVSPDLRIIPFDTYNMFYRGDLEEKILSPIRKELELAGMALLNKEERQKSSLNLPIIKSMEVAD
jgi:hypothetical protein|tara:strand:+ start:588 stop:2090 length:1503 start_codon:yes stop_codon:yes gene_type:complete